MGIIHIKYNGLSAEQRMIAIQRLTALWAFCESGLGGVMHALQIPFTGLVIGGLAVIIITFITKLSEHKYKQVLSSLIIVLIVKAVVSPHTPFPAYIAVSFQALLGIVLFYSLRVNLFSIFLFSIIAMLESAVQQLLILTVFFGQSFWKAADSLMEFIAKQFGTTVANGSQWLIGVYLAIYMLGGLIITVMTYKIIRGFFGGSDQLSVNDMAVVYDGPPLPDLSEMKHKRYTLWITVFAMAVLSALLFVFAADSKSGWMSVVKTVSWTTSAILVWYLIISPLFTRLILWILKKQESRYQERVSGALSFLPVLRRLTAIAWQQSASHKGWNRWYFFFSTLLHWSLTYTDLTTGIPVK